MRKQIGIILFILLSVSSLNAQRTFHYSMGQITDNRFQALCEDSSGFLWIGTENGLNKFDGYSFTHYVHDDSDSLSLVSNYVRSLYIDLDGTLWIGTNHGLQYIRPGDRHFHTVTFSDGLMPYIQQITQFRDGRIWLAVPGHGVYWVDPDKPDLANAVVSLNTQAARWGAYRTILEDRNGTVWLGSPLGVTLYDPNTDKASAFENIDLSGEDITGLNTDSLGHVYISTSEHLFMWDHFSRTITRLTPKEGIREITHSFMDGENLVLSIRGNGMLRLEDGSLKQMELKPNDRSLEKLDVSAFLHDRAGNKWIGCFLSDLILVTNDRNDFKYWNFTDYNEDVSGTVTAMTADLEGNLWVGYNNNRLICFDPDGNVKTCGDRSDKYVSCLFCDRDGQIWAGHPTGGLSKVDARTGRMKRAVTNEYANLSYIVQDKQGRLYYSVLGAGFNRLDIKTMEESGYLDFAKFKPADRGISNDWIHYLFIDSSNRLWMGHDNGEDCFDIDSSEFVEFEELRRLIGNSGCTCFEESGDGKIWIGSGKGIIVLDPSDGDILMLDESKGLSDNDVRSMVKDNDGNIWVSTQNGLDKISPKTYEISRFYTEEKAFNRVGAFSQKNNTVYFASNQGITGFVPSSIRTQSNLNWVVMTGFFLNGERISSKTLSGNKVISIDPPIQSNNFRLAFKDNSFAMEFSTLNFGDEMSISYEYSLDRQKQDWVAYPSGVNRITFTKLPAGKHELSVRARMNDLVSEPRTYIIRIEAPWYASGLAIGLYVLVALLVLLNIYRNFKKKRDREMNDAKFQSFINVAHEICAPMTMIISPLEEMLRDDSLSADVQTQLRQMHKSSTRILSLVNQLLDMRKFDEGRMKLHFAETDLVNFLMGSFELYTQTAERRNIHFTFDHPTLEQPVWIDRDSIDKVMMNLLSNAFKYTPDDGSICVSIETGTDDNVSGPLHNYVQVSVTDTGIGIDKNEIDKVFDRFYRVRNELTSVTLGMGIGLNYSQMLIRMHHGSISAANRPGSQSGSVFSFRLPLGNGHLSAEEITDGDSVARLQLERERAGMDIDAHEDSRSSRGTMKVLVVDDDDSMLEYISDSLKHSYKVNTCRNGKEGLKLAVSQQPDIIITDVVMPEMDGIQLVKALKGNSLVSHIPVIMLSGKNKFQDRMVGIETGADCYLPKPFYMRELKTVISNLINNRLIMKGKFSGKQEQNEQVTPVEFVSSDEQLMKRIMEVVNNNLSNSEFSIEQMVDEVGMSRTQLHRKLKELTGFSASRFVQNIRMQQAMKLLKEKKVNVSQIAYSVGFSSQTHFSTTFKQYYGLTPTEFIKQQENDAE